MGWGHSGRTKYRAKVVRPRRSGVGSRPLNHEEAQPLLPAYAAGELSDAEAGALRTHLSTGCQDCLTRLFAFRVGTPSTPATGTPTAPVEPPPTVSRRRHRYTPLVFGLAAGVAALAAWPIIDFGGARTREPQEAADLANRYAELERTRVALVERLEALDRSLAAAEKEASRQVKSTRSAAKRSAHVKRQLDIAQSRLSSVMGWAPSGEGGATPPAGRPVTDALPPGIGGGGVVRTRPSLCDGLPAAPFGLCLTFCEDLDCDARPSAECARLRGRFTRLTGNAVFPCESVTASEDVTPCDQHRLDLWTFTARAGQAYTATADTVDAASSADLCLLGSCGHGDASFGDDQVRCSFSGAGFGCPRATLVPSADGVCTVAVTVCSGACADPGTVRYRLTVDGTRSLTLVADDAS
jgi:Putative zinc-finger